MWVWTLGLITCSSAGGDLITILLNRPAQLRRLWIYWEVQQGGAAGPSTSWDGEHVSWDGEHVQHVCGISTSISTSLRLSTVAPSSRQ
jgi:hypothetical protein